MTVPVHEQATLHRSQIIVDPEKNARRTLYKGPLNDLADSIKSKGLLQPVGVRPVGETGEEYELVFGYRRMGAMDLLGLQQIPVTILTVDEAVAYELMMEENLHREEVPPWDLGLAVCHLVEKGYNLSQISSRLSMIAGRTLKMDRLHRLAATVSALHPDLIELWKRNTASLDEELAYKLSLLPLDNQIEAFEEYVGGAIGEPEPLRIPKGSGEKRPRKTTRRPSVRATELAYLSLRQHEDDEHDDGLANDDERKGAKKVLQWILGGRTRCPVKARKKDKRGKRTDDAAGDGSGGAHGEAVEQNGRSHRR